MRNLPIALLATLLLAAQGTQAHGAVEVLETEVLLLQDESSDLSYAWAGFDLQSVFVREAYFGGADGLMFRIIASGGNTLPVGSSHELAIGFNAGGVDHTFSWESADGHEWAGDVALVEQNNEDGDFGAVNVNIQAFLPLADLGVVASDAISHFWAEARADGALVDVSPGGFFVAGAPVEATDPLNGDGVAVTDTIVLDGADGYTASTVAWVDGALQVDVENLIGVSGQHVILRTSVEPDHVMGTHAGKEYHEAAISAEAGQGIAFTADFPKRQAMLVEVLTDLGGRELFTLHGDGTVSEGALKLDDHAGDDHKDSPAPLAAGLLALAFARRLRA